MVSSGEDRPESGKGKDGKALRRPRQLSRREKWTVQMKQVVLEMGSALERRCQNLEKDLSGKIFQDRKRRWT